MLNSETKGTGKHMVFVHGNSQCLKVWDAVINSPILQDFTLTTVDLPGHGRSFRSTQPENDYTIKGLAKHLKNFILQFKNEQFIFVATSLGSNLIAEIHPFPENCRGAFLIGATIVGEGLSVTDIIQPDPDSGALFSGSATDEEIVALGRVLIADASAGQKKYRDMYREADPAVRVHLGGSIARQDWSDEINRLQTANIPVAIVYGENDTIVHPYYLNRSPLQKWRDHILIVPGAKHCAEADQPEVITGLISEFAAECFK